MIISLALPFLQDFWRVGDTSSSLRSVSFGRRQEVISLPTHARRASAVCWQAWLFLSLEHSADLSQASTCRQKCGSIFYQSIQDPLSTKSFMEPSKFRTNLILSMVPWLNSGVTNFQATVTIAGGFKIYIRRVVSG